MTDREAGELMLAAATPAEKKNSTHHRASAQCMWLTKHSQLGYEDLCQYTSLSIPLPFITQLLTSHKHEDCEEFFRQITHGNKTEDLSVNSYN